MKMQLEVNITIPEGFAWWTRTMMWCSGFQGLYGGHSNCDKYIEPPVPCTNAALRTITQTDMVTADANTGGESVHWYTLHFY